MSKKIAVVTDSNSGITQTEALEKLFMRILPLPRTNFMKSWKAVQMW